MGSAAAGSIQSIVISDNGDLTDGDASEGADLTSETAFRAQVIGWREACGL